jgi:hypothetical protein
MFAICLLKENVALTCAPNQTMERTATRRVFTFQMIKSLSLPAMPALGGRRSSSSR